MPIINRIGGGAGGGADLAFAVIGSAVQPTAPKEGDIWINTDTNITSWIFSVTEPSSPSEGMAWMSIGMSSAVEFNALAENGIMIYPIQTRQYVGGAWVNKATKSYQGGNWEDWWVAGTLYDNGRYDEATTGGWASYPYSVGTGYSGTTSTITLDDECLTMVRTAGGSSNRSSFVSTVNTIDLTNYTTAHFEFLSASGSGFAKVSVYNASGAEVKSSDMFWSASGSVVDTVDLDISDVSGECRVGVMLWASSSSAVVTVELAKLQLI